jgi:hypothetical protein
MDGQIEKKNMYIRTILPGAWGDSNSFRGLFTWRGFETSLHPHIVYKKKLKL